MMDGTAAATFTYGPPSDTPLTDLPVYDFNGPDYHSQIETDHYYLVVYYHYNPLFQYRVPFNQPLLPDSDPQVLTRTSTLFHHQEPQYQQQTSSSAQQPTETLFSNMAALALQSLPAQRAQPTQPTSKALAALHGLNILAAPAPDQPFQLFRLPPELRFQVYDEIVNNQTFCVSSQHARGSTFSNLTFACKGMRAELARWGKGKPHLCRTDRTGYLDFSKTTFLLDFWTDRASVTSQTIHSRLTYFSESMFAPLLKHLCIDIRTSVLSDGEETKSTFWLLMLSSVRNFTSMETFTLVFDSEDGCGGEPENSFGFTEGGMGFHRIVWTIIPMIRSACSWALPCTCCDIDARPLLRGFDLQVGKIEELVPDGAMLLGLD